MVFCGSTDLYHRGRLPGSTATASEFIDGRKSNKSQQFQFADHADCDLESRLRCHMGTSRKIGNAMASSHRVPICQVGSDGAIPLRALPAAISASVATELPRSNDEVPLKSTGVFIP